MASYSRVMARIMRPRAILARSLLGGVRTLRTSTVLMQSQFKQDSKKGGAMDASSNNAVTTRDPT